MVGLGRLLKLLALLQLLLDQGQLLWSSKLGKLSSCLIPAFTQLTDLFDKLVVGFHVCLMILDLPHLSIFDPRIEVLSDCLQVLELSLILLLDLFIHLLLFKLLVLHIIEKPDLDLLFKLVKIVNILSYPVDCVLKRSDVRLVDLDFDPSFLDGCLDLLLFASEAVYQIAQMGIRLIELTKLLIHLVCFYLKVGDLLFSWPDVFLKLFDFIIEYIFEFFKFLGLLL